MIRMVYSMALAAGLCLTATTASAASQTNASNSASTNASTSTQTAERSIEEQVLCVISECSGCEQASLRHEQSFRTDLHANDANMEGLFHAVEQHFQITISPEQRAECNTVQDLVRCVEAIWQQAHA